MALTLTDAWKEAVFRTGAELRHLVTIADGSNTWQAVDGLVQTTPASGINLPSAVVDISPIAAEVEPGDNVSQIGRVTIEVDDAWVRPICANHRMKGMKVTVALGARSLPTASYVVYFTGFIDEISPQSDGLTVLIECLDVWSVVRDQDIVGAWVNMHPLEVIEDIYANKLGLAASYYDTTSLDPSDSANAANSHLVVTRADVKAMAYLGEAVREKQFHEPTSAKALVNGLLQIINGVQVAGEDGKLTVKIFNPDDAAVAHWDEDEIDSLEQLETWGDLTNKVAISTALEKYYEQNDTDSQSFHAFGKVTSEIHGKKIDNQWLKNGVLRQHPMTNSPIGISNTDVEFYVDFRRGSVSGCRDNVNPSSQPADARPYSHLVDGQSQTNYDNFPTTEGTFSPGSGYIATEQITLDDGTVVTVGSVGGSGEVVTFTVNASAADGTTPVNFQVDQASTTGIGTGFSLTPDTDNVTETRPLYFQILHPTEATWETIKVTTQPEFQDKTFFPYFDPSMTEGDNLFYTGTSFVGKLKVQRSQFSAVRNREYPRYCPLIDITAQVFMATNILDRFGNDTSPKISVRTSLKQFAASVGDLVTIDWPAFLAYGADGIDSSTKWQILSKSVEAYGSSPGIEWTLLRATVGTSTRSHNIWRDEMVSAQERQESARTLLSGALGKVRITKDNWKSNEINVELISGFNVKLNTGMTADLTNAVLSHEIASTAVNPFEDTYIYVDNVDGKWIIKSVANGAGEPIRQITETPVAVVVSDGSGVTSVTNKKNESRDTSNAEVSSKKNFSIDLTPNGNLGDW